MDTTASSNQHNGHGHSHDGGHGHSHDHNGGHGHSHDSAAVPCSTTTPAAAVTPLPMPTPITAVPKVTPIIGGGQPATGATESVGAAPTQPPLPPPALPQFHMPPSNVPFYTPSQPQQQPYQPTNVTTNNSFAMRELCRA